MAFPSLRGAIPTAGQPVEFRHFGPETVEHRHFSFQNLAAAEDGEMVVGLQGGCDDVGGDDEDAVERGFPPIGDDDECVVDNAVAVLVDVEIDGLVVDFVAKGLPMEEPGQLVGRNGVGMPRAMRASGKINLPKGVAARLCPICCDGEGVGVVEHIAAEGVAAFAQMDGKRGVVVVVEP